MPYRKYNKIQMIGFALSTTPGNLHSIEEMSDDGRYLGIDDVNEDMQARLELLQTAIEQAYEMHDKNGDTLKVFTVPEFFFRGNKGAYPGTPEAFFRTYFQEFISSVLAQKKYRDWLFVLGTLVTSEMAVEMDREPVKSLFPMGDCLLDVYNRLHPREDCAQLSGTRGAGEREKSLGSLLRILDEKEGYFPDNNAKNRCLKTQEASGDPAFASVLSAALNYCDSKADIVVDNRCFIVEGGIKEPRIISIQKKYKSKEDFILNGIEDNYIQTITRYPDIPEKPEWKEDDGDPYSIFDYQGIRFGVEICLDHGRGRLAQSPKRWPDGLVDVQLVISCGMDLRPGSVIADTGGIVFNCDGEYVLEGEAENGERCHTMLKLVESCAGQTSPAVLSEYFKLKPSEKQCFPYAGDFYPCRSYQIHVYPACDLTV